MQFQETKAREMELMENSKDENKLYSPKPLDILVRSVKKLCNCKSQEKEPHVHHHHHHVYHHHHHFHHHMYNCFVPASPAMLSNAANDSGFFSSPIMPEIKVEGDNSEINQDFLAPHEQTTRKNSKTSVCSHTLSIHAETSSSVSIEEIVAQTKTSVTLNIPTPTATAGFLAFASSNSASASRKNSGNGKAEVSATTTVSADMNPTTSTSTLDEKEIDPKIERKEEQKSSIRQKDKELLKYRRFSQPAHVKLTRTPSPGISTYNPSEMFDENINFENYGQRETSPSGKRHIKINDEEREISLKDFTVERRDDDCQPVVAASKEKRSPLNHRNISTQSEDDMFESLFNLRQSASYDVTVNQGVWQKLRALCRKVTVSKQFTFFIMGVILLNMICMGLEHYEQVGNNGSHLFFIEPTRTLRKYPPFLQKLHKI